MQPLLDRLSFDGRANRREWWITRIILAVAGLIATLMLNLLLSLMPGSQGPGHLALALDLIFTAMVIFCQLAVDFRRAHDLGETGLPILVIAAGQGLIALVSILPVEDTVQRVMASGAGFFLMALGLVWILFALYYLIRLAFFPGNSHANAYGLPPRSVQFLPA